MIGFRRILSIILTVLLAAVPIKFGGETKASSSGFSLLWPCESAWYVTCLYYYKSGSVHSSRYGNTHSIDIAGGGNILAAESGTVETATTLTSGFGKYVVIKHNNGYRSLYGHLSSYNVSVGQSVSKGQKIGVMGSTGNSSGTHLHFEYSGSDPWKTFFKDKYYSKMVFQENVRSNNASFNSDKTIVNFIDNYYYKSGSWYYNSSAPTPSITLTEDSRYSTPIKAYTMGTGKTVVYNNVDGSAKSNKIYDTDLCTISKVYTNGWCYVKFPLDAGGSDEGYVKTSVFFNTSSREKITVPSQTTTYSRSNCATSIGYIGAGDTVIKVGSSGSLSQVLYPLTAGGYKCGWASLTTASTVSSYNVPFKCRIISATKVRCYYDINYTTPSTAVYIYPDDDCVITDVYDNGKVKVSCPWSDGTTKTVYIDKTAFINSSTTPKNSTAVKYAKTYLRTDMGTNIGWIDAGDAIQIVATSGDKTQIIYPADVGKRCAWVYTSDLTKTYTIRYNANGGTGAPASQTKTSGKGLTLSSTVPTYTGHTFLGWATSASATSAKYSAGGAFNTDADTTLYAVWRANRYTVSYNANGGTGAPGSQTKTYGTAITLSTTKPTCEGYTFIGWSTDKTATTAMYTSGSQYTENKNIELFAVWKANSYTVSFNANGGTNAPESFVKLHGTPATISTQVPSRTGYAFVGWATSANATEAEYQPVEYYYANSAATLYAVWSKTEIPKASVSIESKEANQGEAVSLSVNLTANSGMAYLKFTAQYDSNALELVSVTNGSVFATSDFDRSGNVFQWSSDSNNNATGKLITLNFRVKDTASAGNYQISALVNECYNSSETTVETSVTNGTITVKENTVIDENAPKLVVSNAKANLGKTVDVTVSLANNPGIIGTRFTLSYDKSKLELTAVKNGTVFDDTAFTSNNDITAVPFTVYWEDALASSNNTSNGVLVTFTFKVLEDAEIGTTPVEIAIDSGSTFNYDLDNVKIVSVNGSVEIANRTPGDVNGDGVVNSKDLVILKRYLANWKDVSIDEKNADVNGDGVVNTKDVVILKRYLADWNVTLI